MTDKPISDDELKRGCEGAVKNLLRAVALRERKACAQIARNIADRAAAAETWSGSGTALLIAKEIEARP